jgi:uncharacterized Zn finger protein
MPRKPGLTQTDISAWVGEPAFARSRSYGERLIDQRRTGLVLKARCQGSSAQPYRVAATLGPSGGIAASTCSCPVGGRCKHVAALLLAWLAAPDAFLVQVARGAKTALGARGQPWLPRAQVAILCPRQVATVRGAYDQRDV